METKLNDETYFGTISSYLFTFNCQKRGAKFNKFGIKFVPLFE